MRRSRKFQGIQELKSAHDIDESALLSIENYQLAVTDYTLNLQEAKCQYLKDGYPCRTEHKKGFIIQTKENQNVLIGRCCAFEKLGLLHDDISTQLRIIEKEGDLYDRQLRIEKIIERKDELLSKVKTNILKIDTANELLTSHTRKLSPIVISDLKGRSRESRNEVIWEYQITKIDGKNRENTFYPHSLGVIQGLSCWTISLDQDRRTLCQLRKKLENVVLNEDPKEKEIIEIEHEIRGIRDISPIQSKTDRFLKDVELFIQPKNLMLLPHIISNREVRAKTLEAVSDTTKVNLDKPSGKLITEFDAAFRSKFHASGLRLQR